jgi:replicative DNA helicase Mcm
MNNSHELTEKVVSFYRDYYREEIGLLAQRYPNEQTTLRIDYMDVWRWDEDVADDWLDKPKQLQAAFEQALVNYDLPADVGLSGARVVMVNLPDKATYYPNETDTDVSGYVAIRGKAGRVTTKDEIPLEAAYECQRCGTMSYIPQSPGEIQEPHECQGCERQGPFEIVDNQTEWDDYCKIRIETPPDKAGTANAEYTDGFCVGETVHAGGEHGLIGRAGDDIIAYGTVERQQKDTDKALFERVLSVDAIDFPGDNDNVDIDAHKDTFTELAARSDAVDQLAESIAPALYQTEAWETGMEWAVAYLFAAPRIELPDGTVYRGDIHGAIISDYGMGKSMFSHGIENLSPDCIRKSATALASEVGLTAAAVPDDDFGEGQFTLKPGVLVRGNGGHVILDEIDKGPKDLESINDAIEGQQQVDVEKAGLSATYNSRCGLLALGNPEEGKFNGKQAIAPQIGVDSSLLSRFDGIITMEDTADETVDAHVAEQMGKGYAEANQLEYGDLEEEDLEALDAPVDPEVARAWIKYARENVNPVFKKDLVADIRDWYAEEVRQLNKDFAEKGDGEDMPVPATARVVMWTIRFSVAFARCHLREEVAESDVDRAMTLSKRLVSQNWDGEKFDVSKVEGEGKSQQERRDAVVSALSEGPMTVGEVAQEVRHDYEVVRNDLKKDPRVNQLPGKRFEQA